MSPDLHAGESAVSIVSVYPVLLGTYGDGGNVMTLRHRAKLHGVDVRVMEIPPGSPVPRDADIYVMGGGEDTAQVAASQALRSDGGLRAAAERGAAVLAICAGYQLLGRAFPDAQGQPTPGLDLIDIETSRLPARAVGELVASPEVSGEAPLLTDRLTGYENHAGGTTRGPGVRPLGRLLAGVGNGDGTEGSIVGRIIGTYLHGPCLVRNPNIADQLLSWASGRRLEPISEASVEDLRSERLRTVLGSR
ncbi:MAG: glutamine amidotransferase [Candidatus Nanopelagicales bacterium]|nr:glutamine amidotransferase [Candidatus Nanopelagicales bacterium]